MSFDRALLSSDSNKHRAMASAALISETFCLSLLVVFRGYRNYIIVFGGKVTLFLLNDTLGGFPFFNFNALFTLYASTKIANGKW
jgi:hypothetical protein